MAEVNYMQDIWSELPHYVCIVPLASAGVHGWDTMSLEALTQHLWDAHGLTPVAEGEG